MIHALLFLLVAVLAAPAPAPSASPSAQQTLLQSLDQGDYRPDALALAEQTVSERDYVAMMSASVVNGLKIGLGDSAATLEEASPGVLAEIEQAATRITLPYARQWRERTVRRYARLYTRNLDSAEVANLSRFYGTGVGQKLIRQKFAHIASPETAATLLDQSIDEGQIARINRGAALSAVNTLTIGEKAALIHLTQQPIFKKMATLNATIAQIEVAEANEEEPEFDRALSEAIAEILDRRGLND